jgi:ATP-dependent protease ClpP protease subunit
MQVVPVAIAPEKDDNVWNQDVPIVKVGSDYSVYLTYEIMEPAVYNELCHLLRNAKDYETFHFYICTPGGNLDSAIVIIDAMRNSEALIIGHLSGSVNSAGTMITMACDEIEVAKHTSFMIHYYSAAMQGKGSELKQRQTFMNELLENLMTDVYKGFLTEEEIQSTIEGSDFWFNQEEVYKRWDNRFQTDNPIIV